jgi:hypothetical protein
MQRSRDLSRLSPLGLLRHWQVRLHQLTRGHSSAQVTGRMLCIRASILSRCDSQARTAFQPGAYHGYSAHDRGSGDGFRRGGAGWRWSAMRGPPGTGGTEPESSRLATFSRDRERSASDKRPTYEREIAACPGSSHPNRRPRLARSAKRARTAGFSWARFTRSNRSSTSLTVRPGPPPRRRILHASCSGTSARKA